jgi:hypothetical protein
MNMTGKAAKQVYGENLSALFRMVNYTVPGIREGKIRVGKNEEKYHIITEEAMVVLTTLEGLILKKDLNMNMSLERTMTKQKQQYEKGLRECAECGTSMLNPADPQFMHKCNFLSSMASNDLDKLCAEHRERDAFAHMFDEAKAEAKAA